MGVFQTSCEVRDIRSRKKPVLVRGLVIDTVRRSESAAPLELGGLSGPPSPPTSSEFSWIPGSDLRQAGVRVVNNVRIGDPDPRLFAPLDAR